MSNGCKVVWIAIAAAGLVFGHAKSAQAVLTILAEETGGDVVFTWGGAGQSLDLSSLTQSIGGIGSISGINANDPLFHFFGSGIVTPYAGATLTLFPFGPGSGGFVGSSSTSGSSIWVRDVGNLAIGTDFSYVSLSAYPVGSATFAGETLASLGVGPTTSDITIASWGSGLNADSIVITFTSGPGATVPEPSTATLGLMGLGVLGLATRRRQMA